MGVLFDYFRAADAAAVVTVMEATDGGPLIRHGHEPIADAVDGKGLDPTVVVGRLVSFALDVPWSADLVDDQLVWPAGVAEDPGYEGPWVVVLADRARDAIAGIADEHIPELAQRWSGIEELAGGANPEDLITPLTQLVGLARRARPGGESLYCWICL